MRRRQMLLQDFDSEPVVPGPALPPYCRQPGLEIRRLRRRRPGLLAARPRPPARPRAAARASAVCHAHR
jgi:hypothetical protein